MSCHWQDMEQELVWPECLHLAIAFGWTDGRPVLYCRACRQVVKVVEGGGQEDVDRRILT
jgi:hypothetical protein